MDEFVERLPMGLAAIAGLLVGAVSYMEGAAPLSCIERTAIAMAAFGVLGVLVRSLLQQSAKDGRHHDEYMGRHLDATTPEMTAEDLMRADHGLGSDQGDFRER